MNEFSNMYSKLKEMAQRKTNPKPTPEAERKLFFLTINYLMINDYYNFTAEVDDDEYLLPVSMDQEQTYSIPPPAKPITSSLASKPITGYLEMQPSSKLIIIC